MSVSAIVRRCSYLLKKQNRNVFRKAIVNVFLKSEFEMFLETTLRLFTMIKYSRHRNTRFSYILFPKIPDVNLYALGALCNA